MAFNFEPISYTFYSIHNGDKARYLIALSPFVVGCLGYLKRAMSQQTVDK